MLINQQETPTTSLWAIVTFGNPFFQQGTTGPFTSLLSIAMAMPVQWLCHENPSTEDRVHMQVNYPFNSKYFTD